MNAEGHQTLTCLKVLGASRAGYYEWRKRPPSHRSIRHAWLTDVITKVHADSFGTYGMPRVRAELVLGHGIVVSRKTVALLMRRAGLRGLPARHRPRWRHETPTAVDLVDRQFARTEPDHLWVTDITEHPTTEGKVYCAVVLDTFSRKVVGWSIDSSPTAALATNALGMAIEGRQPTAGRTIIHADHGPQFTSWVFTDRAKRSGLLPSMGSVGDCYDNSMVEAFWGRMQVELLNRKKWRTRIELASAMFEYLEIFHNRKRRHSSLGMLTPIEYERVHYQSSVVA
jgi:transposase InsO family protein